MYYFLYPMSPANIDPAKLLPTIKFQKQVSKVIISILFFFIVYILLLLMAVCLAIACFYGAVTLNILMHGYFTLLLGASITAVGLSVIVFLIKFMFAASDNKNESSTLITEAEQPVLFAFIRKLADETKTSFPKKIYLTDNVNASVFYNSNFWSMFLPDTKNLEIGLGLVNCLNISEFKAVMAHELGHFSQRSMKLGSFTYHINKVIYNLIYENSGYAKFLKSWDKFNALFSPFVSITANIVLGIQWILKQMYRVVNKNYLALGREMEFHADAMAASVAGGNNLVTALSRMQIASDCYHAALNNADELLKQNKKSQNIFSNQLSIFQLLAKDHELPLKHGLPEVSYHFLQTISKSRINYTDQWASHPTTDERKNKLQKLLMDVDPLETRAWQLFVNAERLQEQMTTDLYKTVSPESPIEEIDPGSFESWYKDKRNKFVLPALYKGFYDRRFVNTTDWDLDALCKTTTVKTFHELFNEGNGRLQSLIDMNESDLAVMKGIQSRQINVRSFDFDGVKYSFRNSESIVQQLEKEMEVLKERQVLLDKEAYAFFCNNAGSESGAVENAYRNYQEVEQQTDTYNKLGNDIMDLVRTFYNNNLVAEKVLTSITALKEDYENELKQHFQKFLDEKIIRQELNEDIYNRITHFNQSCYAYMSNNEFLSNELNDISDLIIDVADVLYHRRFGEYKGLIEGQLKYYNCEEACLS